jgi:alpha,alpha-trehalase
MRERAESWSNVKAALFDMDGVVTDTARVHAAAWKRLFDEFLKARADRRDVAFEPFDPRADYLRYVDGKPRADGIRDFLDSRDIELPDGSQGDAPGEATVVGLGKRKNQYFQEWLDENRVEPYPGTLRLLDALRSAGIATAVFSSSRNAEAVLRSAGVLDRFDARVDGNDLGRLEIPGKPDPAMLLEAARQLHVEPAECAVFEDAIIGIEAGVRGEFHPVIAVARGDGGEALKQAGADLVIRDLGEVRFSPVDGLALRTLENLPSAFDRESGAFKRLKGRRPAVFLDYDGTLTPIVADHTKALLADDMRATVAALARRCTVVIVSGRDLARLRELVALDSVWLAGSHGFEIAGPEDVTQGLEKGDRFLPDLDELEDKLGDQLSGIEGHALERKKYSIAVHYRNAASADVDRLRSVVDEALAEYPDLRLGQGKKVMEIGPDIDWHKGKAVRWIMRELDAEGAELLPVYVGDDITDEDAFQSLAGEGIGIAVRHEETRATAADCAVDDTLGVKRLLQSLTGILEAREGSGSTLRDRGEWALNYSGYRPEQEGLREALCTLGNGYCATRGAAPDAHADDVHYPGTYLAGGYNRVESDVAGRKVENEDLVNLPNWLPLTFRVDGGDWFRLDDMEILSFDQELDVVHGLVLRKLRFRDAEGRTTVWRERRLVSMDTPHIAALCVELTPEDWSGRVTVRSALDGGVVNDGVARYRGLENRHLEILEADHRGEDTLFLRTRTNQSLLGLAQAARTCVYRDGAELAMHSGARSGTSRASRRRSTFDLAARATVRVEKIVALYSSRDWAISEPGIEALRALGRAGRFDAIRARHEMAWRHLWGECDMALEDDGAPTTELKLRIHIFHLLQTASKHSVDLDTGIPARGWHGEAYRGHIFWDELFIFPFLSLRIPTLTRALLRYRHRRLGEARQAATEAGYRGAMYPWQSGSDGREETQRLHLNPASGRWLPDTSHRQRHINSAIAYNIWQYYQTSDDQEFMHFYGAEMLLEIARFWASASRCTIAALDRYEIKGVMGPDEYHTAYPDVDPEAAGWRGQQRLYQCDGGLGADTGAGCHRSASGDPAGGNFGSTWELGDEEDLDLWDDISRKLRVPMRADGIISQFEGYEDLEEFDWEGYREKYGDIQRLDRILEAENDSPNRYKVSKQADVLMLFYPLLGGGAGDCSSSSSATRSIRRRSRETSSTTSKRTSHGSTLSQVVHSWVMARSDRSHSWDLFQRVLDSDIADIQGGTTPEGIHVGAMAGSVDLVQRCYLGIGMRGNVLHFDPALRSLSQPDRTTHPQRGMRQGTAGIIVAPGDSYFAQPERVRDENVEGSGPALEPTTPEPVPLAAAGDPQRPAGYTTRSITVAVLSGAAGHLSAYRFTIRHGIPAYLATGVLPFPGFRLLKSRKSVRRSGGKRRLRDENRTASVAGAPTHDAGALCAVREYSVKTGKPENDR